MNGKLLFLALVGVGIFGWLLYGWYAAVDRSVEQASVSVTNPAASSTPPITYVATSTDQEVVLDIQADRSVATLRGLGYATLPLRVIATTTGAGVVYTNTNELLRAEVMNQQLQVFVASTSLFQGVAATSTRVE